MIYFLIFLVFAVMVVLLLVSVVELLAERYSKSQRILRAERDEAKRQVKIAERGLRQIANGISGNPVVEAQVILDGISNVKEIA